MIKVKLIDKDKDILSFQLEDGLLMALPISEGEDTSLMVPGASYTLAFVPFLTPTVHTDHELVMATHDAACADAASEEEVYEAKRSCDNCTAAEACEEDNQETMEGE